MAYALSKATIWNEMGDYDNYNKMTLGEFYECIARMAVLQYKENQPLARKIQNFLEYLLSTVDSKF